MTESDLWIKIKPSFPGAIRIENTAGSGTPDVCYPMITGWSWLELKLRKGNYFYMRKFQLAFVVRTFRLSSLLWPHYLIWDSNTDLGQLLSAQRILNLNKKPYSVDKIQVEINHTLPWLTLVEITDHLGVAS